MWAKKYPVHGGLSIKDYKKLDDNSLVVSKDGDVFGKNEIDELLHNGLVSHFDEPSAKKHTMESNQLQKEHISYYRPYKGRIKDGGGVNDKSAKWS